MKQNMQLLIRYIQTQIRILKYVSPFRYHIMNLQVYKHILDALSEPSEDQEDIVTYTCI